MLNRPTGRSIYPYYYKGGVLYSCDFSGLKKDSAQLLLRLSEEKQFIEKQNGLRIWLNLADTHLNTDTRKAVAEWAEVLQAHILKLALVGVRPANLFGLSLGLPFKHRSFETRCFIDPEEAKTWLVSE